MFKQIRNHFVLCTVAILSVLALTACGDDDDEPVNGGKNGIVGEWMLISEKGWNKEDGTIIESWDESHNEGSLIVTFNSDGTAYLWEGDSVDTGTYSYSGNKLTIKFIDKNGEPETQVVNCKITGDTMNINYTKKEVGYGHTYEFYSDKTFKRISK